MGARLLGQYGLGYWVTIVGAITHEGLKGRVNLSE